MESLDYGKLHVIIGTCRDHTHLDEDIILYGCDVIHAHIITMLCVMVIATTVYAEIFMGEIFCGLNFRGVKFLWLKPPMKIGRHEILPP